MGRKAAKEIKDPKAPKASTVKAIREQVGITQDQAAELVGVKRVTWARWECGICEPPTHAVWRYFMHVVGVERIPFGEQRPA